MRNTLNSGGINRLRALALWMAIALLSATNTQAFEIDTGNSDTVVRWDNTVRYNLAQRVEGRNQRFGNNSQFDEGDYSFDRGDIVTNRLDLLSEFDIVYQNRLGARISGAAWYDDAYDSHAHTNPNLRDAFGNLVPSSYTNGEYSSRVKRYYRGPSGELLDAFVFANFDLAGAAVKTKAGRHTVIWGESLFVGGAMHSVAYAQAPLDLQKGAATPGVEAKELYRPLNQISTQVQLTDNLSIAGQYFLDWESNRFAEGGTYLGAADIVFDGPDQMVLKTDPVIGQVGYRRGDPVTPKKHGEFGLNVRWSPEILDGTVGFYYRRYADKSPQVLVTSLVTVAGNPIASLSQYRAIYADDIDLFGVSLAKNIGGVSVGTELSYRHNTPLLAQTLGNVSASGVPSRGDTPGPRGDTVHALINATGSIASTPLFDSASWAAELTYARWTKISSGENLFNAVGYKGCRGATGDKWDGCATKNYVGLAAAFTPTWFQVLPGVDLSLPLTYAIGLKGNAAVSGGNQGAGSFSIGIGADIYQKHRVDLKYIDYIGKYRTDAAGTVTTTNGSNAALSDRGFVSLTLKTSF